MSQYIESNSEINFFFLAGLTVPNTPLVKEINEEKKKPYLYYQSLDYYARDLCKRATSDLSSRTHHKAIHCENLAD